MRTSGNDTEMPWIARGADPSRNAVSGSSICGRTCTNAIVKSRPSNKIKHPRFTVHRSIGQKRISIFACGQASAVSSIPPRSRSDATACGSLVLHFAAVARAAVDTRNAASPALTSSASCAAFHPSADCDNGTSSASIIRRHARRSLKA
jgi:hypothetical protein